MPATRPNAHFHYLTHSYPPRQAALFARRENGGRGSFKEVVTGRVGDWTGILGFQTRSAWLHVAPLSHGGFSKTVIWILLTVPSLRTPPALSYKTDGLCGEELDTDMKEDLGLFWGTLLFPLQGWRLVPGSSLWGRHGFLFPQKRFFPRMLRALHASGPLAGSCSPGLTSLPCPAQLGYT